MRRDCNLRIEAYSQQLEFGFALYSRFRRLKRMVCLNWKVVVLLGQLSLSLCEKYYSRNGH